MTTNLDNVKQAVKNFYHNDLFADMCDNDRTHDLIKLKYDYDAQYLKDIIIRACKKAGLNGDDAVHYFSSEISSMLKALAQNDLYKIDDLNKFYDDDIFTFISSYDINNVKFILNLGADPNKVYRSLYNKYPYYAVQVAARNGFIEIVNLLIANGANVDKTYAIYDAVEWPNLIKMFIDMGCDVNKVDPLYDMSPLDHAISMIQLSKSKKTVKNCDHNKRLKQTIKLLKKAGATQHNMKVTMGSGYSTGCNPNYLN